MSDILDRYGLFMTIAVTGVLITALLMHVTGDSLWISAYSPNESIPAYHLISEKDIKNTSKFSLLPHEGVIQNRSKIVGKYTNVPISSDEVIMNSMLGDVPDDINLNDTFVVSLVAAPGMMFAGYLQGGDKVDIVLVPQDKSLESKSYNNSLLMDIKECTNESAQKTCIFVVALNRSYELSFLDNMRGSDIRILKVINKNESI